MDEQFSNTALFKRLELSPFLLSRTNSGNEMFFKTCLHMNGTHADDMFLSVEIGIHRAIKSVTNCTFESVLILQFGNVW